MKEYKNVTVPKDCYFKLRMLAIQEAEKTEKMPSLSATLVRIVNEYLKMRDGGNL